MSAPQIELSAAEALEQKLTAFTEAWEQMNVRVVAMWENLRPALAEMFSQIADRYAPLVDWCEQHAAEFRLTAHRGARSSALRCARCRRD